ncbi:MAG TPA: 3-deoxy-D-manno-octulosonic acid transferase [Acidobacteriaceae bacterium]|jgi:3-deoxy-D-manno-octulosonic-acid transferase|nr:3-deoxy-D-manno-octulosonic acid transferase [Acidobacteriaceae bacterium]
MGMALYSLLLAVVLALCSPWWLVRMVRYRAGMWQRLGRVSAKLRAAVAVRQVVWVHAVSVGEVLAATRLVAELEEALGSGWVVVISTTTATGQALAKERFGAERVFFYPLDFAWAVRAYLRALRPRLLVLMESELWPRMLVECGRAGTPVAVVNARVSDRSFARALKVRAIWGRVVRRVDLFLAQSAEDARRLVAMGARAETVRAIGNLKYDVRAAKASRVAELIKEAAAGRPIVVAGSTVDAEPHDEDSYVIHAWEGAPRTEMRVLLVLAPRHPERFKHVYEMAIEFPSLKATELLEGKQSVQAYLPFTEAKDNQGVEIVVLDTLGDLAAVYGVADVAFVGGSLVGRGGHNPLEPTQFGVPVLMGPSYENFRDVVTKMQEADAIHIVNDGDELEAAFLQMLTDRDAARAMGERGRRVFEEQQGATGRAVAALLGLVRDEARR